jgi:site-specific DNA-methyltransferase (adenine-specific)
MTACKWDTVIPFEPLWAQYKRLIKDNGAIVLTASQPFTSALVMSNPKMFRCEWIWGKTLAANFGNIKRHPAKKHESILVFSKDNFKYNPQMEKGKPYTDKARPRSNKINSNTLDVKAPIVNNGYRYPSSIQMFPNPNNKNTHPTQKPVALFEYLIHTYTNEGDTVLDNCAGSFTTAIACINTNRKYICIEKDEKYFEIGKNRIANHQPLLQAVNA